MENFKSNEGFFDLCINVPDGGADNLNDILLRLYESKLIVRLKDSTNRLISAFISLWFYLVLVGYRTVALNQTVNESTMDNDKKKKQKKPVTSIVPDPIDVTKLNEKWRGKLCILNRITFICSTSAKADTLAKCANLRKYDIYAFVPTKQDILEFACSKINADLITIKPEISGIKINRKVYRQAIARDLYFEIQYADLLRQETRIAALHHSYQLQMCRISMNIIVSSGANSRNLIRSPYDIINLVSVLGLRRDRAKAVILNECKFLLLKAKKRISGKAVFMVEFAKGLEVDDGEEAEKKQRIKL